MRCLQCGRIYAIHWFWMNPRFCCKECEQTYRDTYEVTVNGRLEDR